MQEQTQSNGIISISNRFYFGGSTMFAQQNMHDGMADQEFQLAYYKGI
jgi:hypothetical protein